MNYLFGIFKHKFFIVYNFQYFCLSKLGLAYRKVIQMVLESIRTRGDIELILPVHEKSVSIMYRDNINYNVQILFFFLNIKRGLISSFKK